MARSLLARLTDSGFYRRFAGYFSPESYEKRVERERQLFNRRSAVQELPLIAHYWSNRYLLPVLQEYGIRSEDAFFVERLAACCRSLDRPARFVSVGAGDGRNEIRYARALIDTGFRNFTIECLDLNTHL